MYLFRYFKERRMLTRFSKMRRLWIWRERGILGSSASRHWLLLLSPRVRTSSSGWAFTHYFTLNMVLMYFWEIFFFSNFFENLSPRKQYKKFLLILGTMWLFLLTKPFIFQFKKILLLCHVCRSFCYKKIARVFPQPKISLLTVTVTKYEFTKQSLT